MPRVCRRSWPCNENFGLGEKTVRADQIWSPKIGPGDQILLPKLDPPD